MITKKLAIVLLAILTLGTGHLFAQKKNGPVVEKMTSSNGNFIRTANYTNNVLNGPYSEVFEKGGKTKSSGQYTLGKKTGRWDYGKSDGAKTLTEVYNATGGLTQKITYYSNGKPNAETEYKNGKLHGVTKKYDQDGSLKSETTYANGKEHGKQTQHITSTSGNYVCVSHYQNGRKHGEYSEQYQKTGNLKAKGQYKQDKKDGVWIYGEAGGKKTREETYAEGKLIDTKKL